MSSPIEELLKAVIKAKLGSAIGEVTSELVEVPSGSSIEDIIAGRGLKPVGDKCNCGQQHLYEDAEGNKVIVMKSHGDEEPEPPKPMTDGFEERKEKALAGIRRRQAVTLEIYDKLRAMEKSMQQDRAGRGLSDLMDEISLYAEIQVLARKL